MFLTSLMIVFTTLFYMDVVVSVSRARNKIVAWAKAHDYQLVQVKYKWFPSSMMKFVLYFDVVIHGPADHAKEGQISINHFLMWLLDDLSVEWQEEQPRNYNRY